MTANEVKPGGWGREAGRGGGGEGNRLQGPGALAGGRGQPVSGGGKREEHILMQRCCSGSAAHEHERPRARVHTHTHTHTHTRAHTHTHTHTPSAATGPLHQDSSERLRPAGRRGERPRGLAAGLAPAPPSSSIHLPQPTPFLHPR